MMKRIIFIIAVTFCLCACEKQQSHWLNECWCGEYAVTMINNDTGEMEEYVASISLQFSGDRSECVVTKGVDGLFASSRMIYYAYLNESELTFVLNEGDYDSRILFWGKLSGNNKAKLNWYSGEELMSVDLTILTIE